MSIFFIALGLTIFVFQTDSAMLWLGAFCIAFGLILEWSKRHG